MKTVLSKNGLYLVLLITLWACTKTESIVTPSAVIFPGNVVSSGDTFWVSSTNVTFRITRSSPCAPSNEVFFDSIISTNFPSNVTYKWTFGNGQSATGRFAQHTYQYGGVFTVALSVYDNNNTLLQQLTTTVRAYGQYVSPVASFGSQLNNYRDPNWVAFNAQSSVTDGSIVNYFWDWKDGTTSSVATSYTEHRFPEIEKDSNYPVTLTVTSHAGCKAIRTNNVFVPRSYNNVGGITFTKTPACAPDSQVFTFLMDTTGLPSNARFLWDFGDGTKSSTGYWEGNPIKHHFVYSKTYPIVCRIEIDGVTKREFSRNTSVYALGSDIEPIPYLSRITYLNSPINDYIQFDGWGKVGDGHIITKLKWEFGDGTVDSTNTPYAFHQYNQPYPLNRTYNLRLTVTASSGCIGSDTFHIRIP